jgi:hypothetical protein
MRPEIDRLYVFDQGQFGLHKDYDMIDKKLQKTEYRYLSNKVPHKSKEGEVMRFIQTFEVEGVKRSLLFISKNHDEDAAAKFLLDSIVQIENDEELTLEFKLATVKPKILDFWYEY